MKILIWKPCLENHETQCALQYFNCEPIKIPVENEDKTVLIFLSKHFMILSLY